MENIETNLHYDVSVIERLAVIYLKEDAFGFITSKESSNKLLELLKNFQHDPHIKALLFHNSPGVFGETNYNNFLNKILDEKQTDGDFEQPQFCDGNIRFQQIRRLDHYVEFFATYKKLCFTLISGDIVTPFFGGSMAMDIRYATADMYFLLAHTKYGLHPSGGLPFFLVNQIGYNKAMELMFSERITAKEALILGLINKIIEDKNPLEAALIEINKIISNRNCTIRKTKELASFSRRGISEYFQLESIILNL